jgi:hypothetical protein
MSYTLSRRSLLAAAGAMLVTPASAHHGFTGRYDASQPIWLAGQVVRATFAPPHPTIRLQIEAGAAPSLAGPLPHGLPAAPAARAGDAGQELEIELPPIRAFFDLGERLRQGERIEMIALRNCLPPHQLRSQWLRLAGGAVVSRDQRMAYMVTGCEA